MPTATAPSAPQSGATQTAPSTAPQPPPGAQSRQAAAASAATTVRQGTVASWIEGLGTPATGEPGAAQGGSEGTAAPPASTSTPPATGTSTPATTPATGQPKAAEGDALSAATSTSTASPDGTASGSPEPDKWPRSAKEWDNFKKVRDDNYRKRDEQIAALSRDLKARDDRLAALSAANTIDPKLHEELREERDKLSEALRLAAVERHPRFQSYYDGKVASQVDLAKRVVGPDHADSVAAILKLPDSEFRNARLEELMSNLSPAAQSRLGGIVNTVDALSLERVSEIERARSDFDSLQKRQIAEQQQSAAARKAQAEADFAAALADAQAHGFAMLQAKPATDPDAPAWNSAVGQRVNAAKTLLFGQLPPAELARAALAAASFPALLQSHQALQAELAAALAQLAALRSATPTVQRGASEGPQNTATRTPPKVGSRPMDAAADWLKALTAASE